jgi:hypothetical protein
VFRCVDVDRVAFDPAVRIVDPFRFLAVIVACGCGAVCLDVCTDIVAILRRRRMVRIAERVAGRVGVNRRIFLTLLQAFIFDPL